MKKQTISLMLMLLTTAVLSLLLITLTQAQSPDGSGCCPVGPADTGGPDGFGYTWTDTEPPAPTTTYQWLDISLVTGTLSIGDIAPRASTHYNRGDFDIPIGFPFVFYGDVVEHVSISPKGYLTFRDSKLENPADGCPPDASKIPDDAIYVFWDDLAPNISGTIYYQTVYAEPHRLFIVQYDGVNRWARNEQHTFQALLYEGSNEIKFQYKDMQGYSGNGAWSTVAIEQIGATTALTYECNNPYSIKNSLAVSITPPYTLALQPTLQRGYGSPGQQVKYDLTVFNNTGVNQSFDLSLSGNTWNTQMYASNTGQMEHNSYKTIEGFLTVQIPSSANPCNKDEATVEVRSTASGDTYTKKATFATTASSSRLAYVTNSGACAHGYGYCNRGTLSVIDVGGGYCELNSILVGEDPEQVVVDGGTSRIFVANEDDPSLSIIDVTTEKLASGRANLGLGAAAYNDVHGLALSPTSARLYATAWNSSKIFEVDTVGLVVAREILTSEKPWRLAVTPDGNKLYATSFTTTLSVVNLTNYSVQTVNTGINLLTGVAVSPDGNQVYAVSKSDNKVAVIDTATDNLMVAIPLNLSSPAGGWDVVFSPNGDRAYVSRGTGVYGGTSADLISVIDTANGTEIDTIPTGSNPSGLAISGDGLYLYVVNNMANTVSVINISTKATVGSISVGDRPSYIALKSTMATVNLPVILRSYQ